jgi:hypothetical protein
MNTISGYFNAYKSGTFYNNFSSPEVFSNLTGNFSQYVSCLNSRVSSFASQIFHVTTQASSWNNLTLPDFAVLESLKNHSVKFMQAFPMSDYCFGVDFSNFPNATQILCQNPPSDQNFLCFEQQSIIKKCGELFCNQLNQTTLTSPCLQECFTQNNMP